MTYLNATSFNTATETAWSTLEPIQTLLLLLLTFGFFFIMSLPLFFDLVLGLCKGNWAQTLWPLQLLIWCCTSRSKKVSRCLQHFWSLLFALVLDPVLLPCFLVTPETDAQQKVQQAIQQCTITGCIYILWKCDHIKSLLFHVPHPSNQITFIHCFLLKRPAISSTHDAIMTLDLRPALLWFALCETSASCNDDLTSDPLHQSHTHRIHWKGRDAQSNMFIQSWLSNQCKRSVTFPSKFKIIQNAMTSTTSWASCKSSFSRWRRCLSSSCFWYQESDLRSVDIDIRVLPMKTPPVRRPAAHWALASHEHPVVTWVEVVLSAWKTA